MNISIISQPYDYILSPYESIDYVVRVDVPSSNLIRFEVSISGEYGLIAKFESIGEAETVNNETTILKFNLQRILQSIAPPTTKPNYMITTPMIDYEAVRLFVVSVRVFDLSGANTEAVVISDIKKVWNGKNLRGDRLLLNTNKKTLSGSSKNFISYLCDGELSRSIKLMATLYYTNGTSTNTTVFVISYVGKHCIITFPLLFNGLTKIEYWVEELETNAIYNKTEKLSCEIIEGCYENVVFLNECGGWENYLFQSISQSEAKIESSEISNITYQNLPNKRNQKTVFKEIKENFKAYSRSVQDFEKQTLIDFFQSYEVYLQKEEGLVPIQVTGDSYVLYMKKKLLFLSFTFFFATSFYRNLEVELQTAQPIINCLSVSSNKISIDYNTNAGDSTDIVRAEVSNINTGEVNIIEQVRSSRNKNVLFGNGNFGANGTVALIKFFAYKGNSKSLVSIVRMGLQDYVSIPLPTFFTINSYNRNSGQLSIGWSSAVTPCFALFDDRVLLKVEIWRFGFPNRTYRFINSQNSFSYDVGERIAGIKVGTLILEPNQSQFTIQAGDVIKLIVRMTRTDGSQGGVFLYTNQNNYIVP